MISEERIAELLNEVENKHGYGGDISIDDVEIAIRQAVRETQEALQGQALRIPPNETWSITVVTGTEEVVIPTGDARITAHRIA